MGRAKPVKKEMLMKRLLKSVLRRQPLLHLLLPPYFPLDITALATLVFLTLTLPPLSQLSLKQKYHSTSLSPRRRLFPCNRSARMLGDSESPVPEDFFDNVAAKGIFQ